jgi:hypothetical protein
MLSARPRVERILPVINVFLAAALGIAINFATDLKTSWIAWSVVGVISVTIGLATVIVTGRRGLAGSGTVITTASQGSSSSHVAGLVMRTTETTSPDGSNTRIVEFYSDQVAMRAFRENFPPSTEDD